jgi:hypothetical protein
MDPAYLSALAALAGSAVGGLTSFLSTWLSQSAVLKAQLLLQDKARRQEIYRIFVEEASHMYIDALTHDTPTIDESKRIALYALVSRMRIISSQRVIDEGEKMIQTIVALYDEPNMTPDDIRKMVKDRSFDPLRAFSECCREELRVLKL